MSEASQQDNASSIQSFEAVDEDTKTKPLNTQHPFAKWMGTYRKRIFFLYLFIGIVLFYLLITKPPLRDPYLIEIFNR